MKDSNLIVACIVTNLVAQGTRAHVKLVLSTTEISGIDLLVDGRRETEEVDLGEDRARMITLRCNTTPKQARVRWRHNDRWISPNTTYGHDFTFLATPKDHGKKAKCEADSGIERLWWRARARATSENFYLRFEFPTSVEDFRQEDGVFFITVSGNPSRSGTVTMMKIK